jgi:pyrimidine 5'-nucleotidase
VKDILLLDYDHTLYPSTLSTLRAVDDRINLYIRTFLGFTSGQADALRVELWDKYGTTLKGLEELHGVDREHYCDFIHAIEASHLPPPDPALQAWLTAMPHPCYLFTNARMDWPVRGLKAMGLEALLPRAMASEGNLGDTPGGFSGGRLLEIFDIAFMDWDGKPNPPGYAKVDARLRERHGQDLRIHFADDRQDNLESARERGWRTIWIVPHTAAPVTGKEFDRVVASLTDLDPVHLS